MSSSLPQWGQSTVMVIMDSSASPTIFAFPLPHHSLFHHYPIPVVYHNGKDASKVGFCHNSRRDSFLLFKDRFPSWIAHHFLVRRQELQQKQQITMADHKVR